MYRFALRAFVVSFCIPISAIPAQAGPKLAVADAIDPDCTAIKAAQGAAVTSTVGVRNRCDVSEVIRGTAGVDGKADGMKSKTAIKKIQE